jgi:hypothetical protein
MGAAFNRLSFCPRDSKRLQVTPVHDAIRADELWLKTAIEAGLVLAEMDRGIVEKHGFRTSIDARLADNSGHCLSFSRLTMWSMRTNIEHGGLRITHWGAVAARHYWHADA